MTAIALYLATVLALQDTTRPPTFSNSILLKADSIAAAEYAKDRLGSITVGIVSGPDLVWVRSYGYADSARTQPAVPTSVYRIASITKQFTAVMLLQLVERGRVGMADPVSRWFPEIRNTRRTSVVRSFTPSLVQLATMTSGLARDPDDARKSQTGRPETWLAVLTAALRRTEFKRSPGSGYAYSNIGYAILGAALERAAGQSYVGYQNEHILLPLGMTSTGFELSPELRKRLATGVDYDELYRDTLNYNDASAEHRLGLGFRVPSGGLYSTVGDLAKLVSLELGYGPESVLRRETLKLRQAVPVASLPTLDYGYGLGFQAYRWADTVAVGHSGNLAGYTSMVLYDTERKYGVIVLRSAAGGNADAGRLAGRVFRKLRTELK